MKLPDISNHNLVNEGWPSLQWAVNNNNKQTNKQKPCLQVKGNSKRIKFKQKSFSNHTFLGKILTLQENKYALIFYSPEISTQFHAVNGVFHGS